MAELVSQQSSSPVYRAACELAAYRLRDELSDKPFIEYGGSLEAVLQCLPKEVASITVASAVDGSQATLKCKTDDPPAVVYDTATKTLPWLKRCGLEPGWSRPYTEPKTQSVVISFVAPLVRDGKVVAAVAAGSVPVGARASKKRPAAPAFLAVTEPRLRSRLLYPNPVCLCVEIKRVDGVGRPKFDVHTGLSADDVGRGRRLVAQERHDHLVAHVPQQRRRRPIVDQRAAA